MVDWFRSLMMCVVLLGVGAAQPALAGSKDSELAKQHYVRGTKLYDLQRFLEAAHEYELAFELKDSPDLLFNIAQAYRLAGEHAKAIGAFRAFLRRMPDSPHRPAVLARVEELNKIVEDQRRSKEKPPSGTLTPPEQPGQDKRVTASTPPQTGTVAPAPVLVAPPVLETPAQGQARLKRARTFKIAGLSLGVVGLAAIGAGAGMAVLAQNANNAYNQPARDASNNPPVWGPEARQLKADYETYQSVEVAMLAVGGVALVGGVTLAVLGFRSAKPSKLALAPVLGPGFSGVTFSSSF
jgi:tetratricopeptide (TPR) repeat protein